MDKLKGDVVAVLGLSKEPVSIVIENEGGYGFLLVSLLHGLVARQELTAFWLFLPIEGSVDALPIRPLGLDVEDVSRLVEKRAVLQLPGTITATKCR